MRGMRQGFVLQRRERQVTARHMAGSIGRMQLPGMDDAGIREEIYTVCVYIHITISIMIYIYIYVCSMYTYIYIYLQYILLNFG